VAVAERRDMDVGWLGRALIIGLGCGGGRASWRVWHRLMLAWMLDGYPVHALDNVMSLKHSL